MISGFYEYTENTNKAVQIPFFDFLTPLHVFNRIRQCRMDEKMMKNFDKTI